MLKKRCIFAKWNPLVMLPWIVIPRTSLRWVF